MAKARKAVSKPGSRRGQAAGSGTVTSSSSCLQCQEPGCAGGCPIGVGVPSILALASSGRIEEAANLLRLTSPIASITGRLCPSWRFCERACVLSRKGSPVAIRSIEAYLGDMSLRSPVRRGRSASGKVLVVGSGPAGLTAAHDLHANGFDVRVVESETLAGGRLRCLPESQLPRGILDSEVDRLRMSGIAFVTSNRFEAWDPLPVEGHVAIVLTTGLPGQQSFPDSPKRDPHGFIMVDQGYRASLRGVYAAGDAIQRFESITEAMASSRGMVEHLLRDHLFSPQA